MAAVGFAAFENHEDFGGVALVPENQDWVDFACGWADENHDWVAFCAAEDAGAAEASPEYDTAFTGLIVETMGAATVEAATAIFFGKACTVCITVEPDCAIAVPIPFIPANISVMADGRWFTVLILPSNTLSSFLPCL